MQMSSQKNYNKGFCLLGGTFLRYFEVEFAVLEWDGVFCSTDTSFLNQLLVIALKRQHKNNSCTSIILPLCRLQEELNFSPFPANIVSAFSIHFLFFSPVHLCCLPSTFHTIFPAFGGSEQLLAVGSSAGSGHPWGQPRLCAAGRQRSPVQGQLCRAALCKCSCYL